MQLIKTEDSESTGKQSRPCMYLKCLCVLPNLWLYFFKEIIIATDQQIPMETAATSASQYQTFRGFAAVPME